MQIVSFIGDNLHEISKPIFWENIRKNILKETNCMKWQNLFSGKNKNNIMNLLFPELV